MKKTKIIDRICNAWRVLLGKPDPDLSIEIGMQRCDECDYYKKAHEPVQIVQNDQNDAPEPAETAGGTKKAPIWTDGPTPYYHEIEYQENRVLVTFYEDTEDGAVEIVRSYGLIRSKGAAGIAQATSFAMSLIWYQMTK